MVFVDAKTLIMAINYDGRYLNNRNYDELFESVFRHDIHDYVPPGHTDHARKLLDLTDLTIIIKLYSKYKDAGCPNVDLGDIYFRDGFAYDLPSTYIKKCFLCSKKSKIQFMSKCSVCKKWVCDWHINDARHICPIN